MKKRCGLGMNGDIIITSREKNARKDKAVLYLYILRYLSFGWYIKICFTGISASRPKKKVARMTLSEQTIFTPGVKTELVRRCPKTSKGSVSSNSLWNRDDMYSKNVRKRADKCAARVFACFRMRMSKTKRIKRLWRCD